MTNSAPNSIPDSRGAQSASSRVVQSIRLVAGDSKLPLHEQLYRRIRELILSGTLPAGSKLPSSRTLASSIGISRNSILTALERLAADGWIETRRGSGIYTAYRGTLVQDAAISTSSARRPDAPFAVGQTAVDLFPVKVWQKLQTRRWSHPAGAMLQRGDWRGWPDLRVAIAAHAASARGLNCSAEQVIVTTGTRTGLELAIRALDLAGSDIWMEDPGFHRWPLALRYSGVTLVPVPVDEEGLQVDIGEKLAPNARAAHITPACQFPTCVAMSETRRGLLRAWASRTDSWIFEADYGWQSYIGSQPPLPVAASEPQRTVYFGSFNHTLFAGLCIAFLIVPLEQIDRFAAIDAGLDGQASVPNQVVLGDFMNGGHLDEYFRRFKAAITERKAVLLDALDQQGLATLVPHRRDAGLHLVCDLVSKSEDDAIALCRANHIAAAAMHQFRDAPAEQQQLLLGYASFKSEALAAAAHTLGTALR